MEQNRLDLAGPALRIQCNLAPWDADIFGFPVAQIHGLQISDTTQAALAFRAVLDWLDKMQVRIASSRLPHGQLRESMFLEDQGFRFVEMVLHPKLANLDRQNLPEDTLAIEPAEESDLASIVAIAESAFRYERYHVDPRLDARLANKRYGRWARNSYGHPSQRLLKIRDSEQLVAFFVVEDQQDGGVYWHLTAVAPNFQGRGYGRRTWQAMLRHHRTAGAAYVATTISARNVPVLSLYSRLGFSFLPPEMTFHWVREN